MNPKAEKLLRLALDPASPEGEYEAASIKFIRLLRADGATVEAILGGWQRSESARQREVVRFTFGKHQGVAVEDVPSDYLIWFIETIQRIDPLLRRTIIKEIQKRNL